MIFYGDRIIKKDEGKRAGFKCSPSILGRRPALCLTSIVRAGATRNLALAACTPYGSISFESDYILISRGGDVKRSAGAAPPREMPGVWTCGAELNDFYRTRGEGGHRTRGAGSRYPGMASSPRESGWGWYFRSGSYIMKMCGEKNKKICAQTVKSGNFRRYIQMPGSRQG